MLNKLSESESGVSSSQPTVPIHELPPARLVIQHVHVVTRDVRPFARRL